jgi:hypothetical protein
MRGHLSLRMRTRVGAESLTGLARQDLEFWQMLMDCLPDCPYAPVTLVSPAGQIVTERREIDGLVAAIPNVGPRAGTE